MKRSKSTLLQQHLEDISGTVLDVYPGLVGAMIKKKSGVYALYREGNLYYVGLASNLMGRLKTHLRDRHRKLWDRFSVYLTADSDHIKELESLLLRIVKPRGNKVSGGFSRSKSLRGELNRRIAEVDANRRSEFMGGAVAKRRRRTMAKRGLGSEALQGIAKRRIPIRAVYKGTTFKAHLRSDGQISLSGKLYASPSAAGKAILGRGCAGWRFWKYRDEKKQWVPLQRLRR